MSQLVLTIYGTMFFNDPENMEKVEQLKGFYLNQQLVSWYAHPHIDNSLVIEAMIETRVDASYIVKVITDELISKGARALLFGINQHSMSVGDDYYIGRQEVICDEWLLKYDTETSSKLLEKTLISHGLVDVQGMKKIYDEIDDYFESEDTDK